MSVIPDYLKLKKYNLNELWSNKDKEQDSNNVEKSTDEKLVEAEVSSQEKSAEAESLEKPENPDE